MLAQISNEQNIVSIIILNWEVDSFTDNTFEQGVAIIKCSNGDQGKREDCALNNMASNR